MMKEKIKTDNFFYKNRIILIAFAIPVLVLCIIFVMREVVPFGNQIYMRSDMYHQYVPFLKQFQTIIKSGGSMEYTWNIGLGTNFISTYAYYAASPFNWIAALLPENGIPVFMDVLIILKSGLMSAAFAYFITRRVNYENLAAAAFGSFYALSSYMAAYSWNVMWLDCLILLPLIILGLERLVKKGKHLLYVICLALAVLSNYYIAIMLCIFAVLYFVYLLVCECRFACFKNCVKVVGRFALWSFLAGLAGAVLVLPAYLTLLGTASSESTFPQIWKFYFGVAEMISKAFMNLPVTMLEGYLPNIYCTVAAFTLIPLYWFNRAIPLKQKLGKSILIVILLFSFICNVPAFIWHGFHFPNSLPSRESFIYIFLILFMGYEAFVKIKRNTVRDIILFASASSLLAFFFYEFYKKNNFTVSVLIVNIVFIAAYAILFLLTKRDRVPRFLITVALLSLCFIEGLINTETTGYSTTNYNYYVQDNEDIEKLIEGVSGNSFVRIEKQNRRTKNDGAWSGYNSASIFSSTTTAGLSEFYDVFGLQSSTNSFSYYGRTPLTSAILGVKYEIGDEKGSSDPLKTLVDTSGNTGLYQNKYSLSLGFLINQETEDEVDYHNSNPFEVQNTFVKAAIGTERFFDIGECLNGQNIEFTIENEGRLYAFISDKISDASAEVKRGEEIILNKSYSDLENPMIIEIGDVKEGDRVTIKSEDPSKESIALVYATLTMDVLDSAMRELYNGQLNVEEYSATHVKGSVTVDERTTLFTSIPYDAGWTVYVDGKETAYEGFKNAFIMVELSKGSHTVEFKFRAPGLRTGMLISLGAVLVIALFSILKSFDIKKKTLINKES